MKNFIFLSSLLLFLTFLYSCRTVVNQVSDAGLTDNEYDRDIFQAENNNRLESLASSVKMLNCLAYYESYLFDREIKLKKDNLDKHNLRVIAAYNNNSTETASGTATIVYSSGGKIALLTCAHIIDFPDTLITYHKDDFGKNTEYIESLSIKIRQTNLLPEFSVSNAVKILAIDKDNDIALVGRDITTRQSMSFVPFGIEAGNTEELTWGTKVYIIGFPLNNKMITSGLVSPSQTSDKNYFFVDAVFNRGFSGGMVLAVRDGAPNFEMVGMVKSGTVHRKFELIPDSENPNFNYIPNYPYDGEILVKEDVDMKYGVTRIMSVEKVFDFLSANNEHFIRLGYNPDLFFLKPDNLKKDGRN